MFNILGLTLGYAACVVVGFFVFVYFDSVHDVEGASWIAILAGLMITTFLGWAVAEIWESM